MNIKMDLLLLLVGFVLALSIGLILIPILKKLKAGQSILKYVDMHEKKSGTPTIGGIIFILPVVMVAGFLVGFDTPLSMILIIASVGYGLIGFLDDFLKIRGKKNLGLKAYQKIIGQGGVAALVSYFFMTINPNGELFIPFFNGFVSIGALGIFALTFIILIASTNAVNLTDGIDGLAGNVSVLYLIFIYILMTLTEFGDEGLVMGNIIAVAVGALMAFLLFNTKKASVFMGDTGSLFLGGFIAMVSLFSNLGLVIIFLGIIFVWSTLSVIIQVLYFKITNGKRIFLMAPFHHHLEKIGVSEPKIVNVYSLITILMGILLVLSTSVI